MICTDEACNRDTTRWIVQLNSGTRVYQDDRPEDSAWIRLREHCREKGVFPVRMWIQFRSNIVEVGTKNADGYYYARGVVAMFGLDSMDSCVVGHVSDGVLHIKRYIIPELTPLDSECRDPNFSGESLILVSGTDILKEAGQELTEITPDEDQKNASGQVEAR